MEKCDNINTTDSKADDEVDITINYQGTDYLCKVNLETANILLNDSTQANKYVEQHIFNRIDDNDNPQTSTQENPAKLEPPLWSSKCKNNSAKDHEATLLLLKLRLELAAKFNDRKTMKQGLWQNIAREMKEKRFPIEGDKEGAEKCRQKFSNLQRTYMNHITHMKRTGEETKRPPPYFNEIHDILGNKDKTNPPYLEDSLQQASTSQTTSDADATGNEDTDVEQCSEKKAQIKNRFVIHKYE
jgi:hypothetical protein